MRISYWNPKSHRSHGPIYGRHVDSENSVVPNDRHYEERYQKEEAPYYRFLFKFEMTVTKGKGK